MSWHYSQALVAAYSADTSLGGAPYAPLSGSPIPQAFLCSDRMTAFSRLSRFGMTFKPLTGNLGEDLLTWFLAGFPARTFLPLEKAQESTAPEAGCGSTWHGSLARFDRATSSWRTPQCSLLEGLDEFSETWPRWGMMRNGECSEQSMPAHLTSGTESGLLLPTPLASLGTNGGPNARDSSGRPGLQMAAMMWPTPCANESGEKPEKLYSRMERYGRTGSQVHMKLSTKVQMWPTPTVCGNYNQKGMSATSGDGLATAVKMWPTPTVDDSANVNPKPNRFFGLVAAVNKTRFYPTPCANEDSYRLKGNSQQSNCLGAMARREALKESPEIRGQLNPTWVEKLMGWPQNWTEVKPMIDFQFISWIMGFCECEKTRTNEVMRVLRNSNGAQNFQRKVGRPIGIQEAEVLLSVMFQHQIGSDEAWLLMEGAEAPQGEVRSVQLQACATSSPHRSGHQEQPTGEHPDAMQTLSRLLAYDGEAAWKDQSWENAVPRVATGVAARVDRLKAIGNGQVSAVVRLAWETLSKGPI